MNKIWILISIWALASCGGKEKRGDGTAEGPFEVAPKKMTPPYTLSDTGFLKNRDTATVSAETVTAAIPDSFKRKWFGAIEGIRYSALAQFEGGKKSTIYLLRGVKGNKRAAFLLGYDGKEFTDVFPFLVPDTDPLSSQVSTLNKNGEINKTITVRKRDGSVAEGREVGKWDANDGIFMLVLTNPIIAEGTGELINPIDTFGRTHAFAGDYTNGARNIVSIRDGRFPNQLQLFVHVEANEGACSGELRGDLLLTSSTTAVYRENGDPCVLNFKFSAGKVTLAEDEGCGSHRGIDCSFNGTFTRKKNSKTQTNAKQGRQG